jgi:O-antigen chain-terminating methyltransferase
MVEECRERGLVVNQAEALACLRALPDASLGAVTGLHIIEHLPLATLVGLLDEALRVVRPGGLLILETPNPENLMVSGYNFYFDPTHRNPLPPLLSSFMLEGRGWAPVEIVRMNPYPEHQRFSVEGGPSQVTSWLNEVFCGPQDYAVIGHKP